MINLLFSLNGRINRTKWWIVTLAIFAFSQAISFYFKGFLGPDGKPSPALTANMGSVLTVIGIAAVFGLLSIWIQFAVDVKRFHDRGKSFWWPLLLRAPIILLLAIVISFASAIVSAKNGGSTAGAMGMLAGYGLAAIACVIAAAVGGIWILIECGFCSGDIDDNEFGPGDGMNVDAEIAALRGVPSGGRSNFAPAAMAAPAAMSAPRQVFNSNGRPAFGKRM